MMVSEHQARKWLNAKSDFFLKEVTGTERNKWYSESLVQSKEGTCNPKESRSGKKANMGVCELFTQVCALASAPQSCKNLA